jgi:hypothetical protein
MQPVHSLSECQTIDLILKSNDMLTVLRLEARNSLSRIVTGDESWFLYQCPSDHIFTASRNKMTRREKEGLTFENMQSVFLMIDTVMNEEIDETILTGEGTAGSQRSADDNQSLFCECQN